MKRSILTGILALATGMTALMAQQGKQGLVPNTKSPGESQAVVALMQAQGNPDAMIKAANDLVEKYADSFYKETALLFEANAYKEKGDLDHAQIYGEQVLKVNPKNYQITNLLGTMIVQRTRENDLDKEEKLSNAEKYFNLTLEDLKTATKPNPQLTDDQWEQGKKYLIADAHNGLGMVALTRKKYDTAIAEFKTATETDPGEPTYQVRLASALQSAGKNAEAIEVCDKVLATPQLHPQIKAVAENIKAAASKK
jgi:tetratricopeptide (TPR) repeat protein